MSKADYIILGCVAGKRDTSAGGVYAADLYTSFLWKCRRTYAESAGVPWGILSAWYGLIHPTVTVLSYDRVVGDLSRAERRERIDKARATLLGLFGGKPAAWGKVIEVHAGKAYVDLVVEAATGLGIKVVTPLEGMGLGEQLQWYSEMAVLRTRIEAARNSSTQTAQMKNTETMETPAAAGPANASPELIAHEWDVDGICTNPEVVNIDFGKKGDSKRAACVRLGLSTEGKWYFGVEWKCKGKTGANELVRLDGNASEARHAALRLGLGTLMTRFAHCGDKVAVAALEGFFDKTWPEAATERLAANKVERAPLPKGRFAEIRVDAIAANPEQVRKSFNAEEAQDLKKSIEEVGLLHPIGVRLLSPAELGELPVVGEAAPAERYEIIYGERRWRAHVALSRETIEAKVYEGVTRAQGRAAALIENLQGEDLNPIEEAEGYRELMETEGLTQDDCADRVGKSRSVVANALRILNLPKSVLDFVREGKLTNEHGVRLARFKPKDKVADQFPSWQKAVHAIAELAIALDVSSASLEKGVPFEPELKEAGIGCYVMSHETGGEFPKEIKGHPAYFARPQAGGYFCLEPAHWQALVKAHKAAEREAQRKRDEREAKKAAKGKKIKTLQDLPRDSYVQVEEGRQGLLKLVPDEAIDEVDSMYGAGKVTICTRPEFFKKIEGAVRDLITADRDAKVPALVAKGRKKIESTKKLGPREIVMLLAWATHAGYGTREGIYAEPAKALGVKLPAKWMPHVEFTAAGLAQLQEISAVDAYRVIALGILNGQWGDDPKDIKDFHPNQEAAVLLTWLLEVDDLGLLEQTKAGQKELLSTVEKQEWYKTELAAIEAEEAKK